MNKNQPSLYFSVITHIQIVIFYHFKAPNSLVENILPYLPSEFDVLLGCKLQQFALPDFILLAASDYLFL